MSHLKNDKAKLIARVRRMRGQMEAIERELENDASCSEVLQLVASVRGAMNGLTIELVEEHIRHHVVDPDREPDEDRAEGARDLIAVVRTYMK
ncbi:metal/formaldehyde-sensitive transcriptional repressor [Lutibaculum baratangense]|uniref:Uncharacterized protein n=1 Tax=Lutibaculum baratangense AMV1 TaxID=631454 RepID=V4QW62_9HYPH|nr:metal/formaldehyde-sensitive transcriptional repressor [Lutibaculum baratangense]ESR23962.1 protein of unknown function DUF156 [Lutibaculum baratangense AMV1]